MTKLKDGPGEENNPIVQYQEWADNRYNSGYWLGGNVPPSTRNFWSGVNRRLLGGVYVGTCVIAVGLAVHYAKNGDDLMLAILTLSVYFIPGLIMLLARDQKRRRRRADAAEQRTHEEQHGHHHGHGRFSDH